MFKPDPKPMSDRLLTVGDVAELLQLGRSKTYELVMSGTIPSVLIGRSRRIMAASVDAYIKELHGAN